MTFRCLNLTSVSRRPFMAAFLLLVVFSCGKGLEGDVNAISRPGMDGGPTTIEAAIYVLNITSINTPGQSFAANVFFVFRWKDPRLAHDKEGLVSYELDEVWNPQLQIFNRQRLVEVLEPRVEVSSDGSARLRFWYWGDFAQSLDLKDFPFDRQEFNIRVVSLANSPDEITFVPFPEIPSGLAGKLSVPDWDGFTSQLIADSFKPLPVGPEVAGVTLQFSAKRLSGYFWVKVILPLILVVFLSWAVLWIDPTLAGTQLSMAITAMLTLIAYRFSIGASLPNLSYLTRLDYFVLVSTILVFLTLVEVVITSAMSRLGQTEKARTVDRVARFAFPAVLIYFLFDSLILGLPA